MGNHRVLLYFTLIFLLYMIWAQWQIDYAPKPEPGVISPSVQKDAGQLTSEDIPQAITTDNAQIISPVIKEVAATSERIKIVTDVLDVEVDTRGGNILSVVLRNYAVTADKPEEKLVLMTDANINYHVAQSGLVSVNKDTAPSHNGIYSSEQSVYRLAEGEDVIEVPLYWQDGKGVSVKKVLTFKRDNYIVDVNYYITAGQQNWSGSDYMQITRSRPVEGSGNAFIRTYTGGVVYNEEIK